MSVIAQVQTYWADLKSSYPSLSLLSLGTPHPDKKLKNHQSNAGQLTASQLKQNKKLSTGIKCGTGSHGKGMEQDRKGSRKANPI